ncbi:MAG: malto-oligosyltrehalose synthase [Actinomycetes bacterium]
MTETGTPTSTYRLQLTPDFRFVDAAEVVPYLAELGVSHVYCSPVFEAAPGSTHGYDLVDPAVLRGELGGPAGFARLVAACHDHGLGLVVDVVPNHMHVGAPEQANAAWWDVLRRGQDSPFAGWFDIDWAAPGLDGKVLVPVLGDDPAFEVVDGTLRYGDHTFPLAEGTAELPIEQLLDEQNYRLAHWREESRSLNYRRFFGISTLAGVRVEQPTVFDATHRLVGELIRRGTVSGLRIDHPDGLANPAGYLDALAAATGSVWTVVEKILEADEELPRDWQCAGTTGYDALNHVDGLFIDTDAEADFTSLYAEFTGERDRWDHVVRRAKTDVLDRMLAPEVARLARLIAGELNQPTAVIAEAVRALLIAMPVYRVYLRPVHAHETEAARELRTVAADAARDLDPEVAKVVDQVRELIVAGPPEVVTRFQQTSGPVMAKGVEDTAFYRYHRLSSLCEVGGDPGRFGRGLSSFHTYCARTARGHPATMTTLSTHDTKRSEDVRARVAVLTEIPAEWRAAVSRWSSAATRHWSAAGPDHTIEYLIWQTLVGAWPIEVDRVLAYIEKAAREAGTCTAWVDGDDAYERAVADFVRGVLGDAELGADIAAFIERIVPAATANSLAQKLVQLTMPGVPDVYQGCELVDLSLVDPDNRRNVDFDLRRRLLAAGTDPKLHVVRTALTFRRERPDCFGPDGAYHPISADGVAREHLVAFRRGEGAITLATRLSDRLRQKGGWAETVVGLPPGPWTEQLSGREVAGGPQRVNALLDGSAVALLGKTSRNHS